MLRLNCFIQVADAAYDAVLEEAKALTAASLKEEGAELQQVLREKEAEARVQYADAVLSLDEIMTAYREKVAEMNAALSAMVPPPGFVPEQQRDYYSARRVASVHTEYDLSGYQPTVWKCNLCGALHNCPSECAEPQLGGTWVYVTPEQYIEENGDFIVKQRTLMIE